MMTLWMKKIGGVDYVKMYQFLLSVVQMERHILPFVKLQTAEG